MISDVVTLVFVTRSQNAIGAWEVSEQYNEVYAEVDSVSRSEWFEAGKAGLRAEYRFTIFCADYHGEERVIYKGTAYGVYRTYHRTNDRIELYCERQVGA